MRQDDSSSTERFSVRALDYARFRPQYPPGLIRLLTDECRLAQGSAVADIGSGTGIFSRNLLATGATVYAVEPNAPMRCTADLELATWSNFSSVDGTAEHTGLPDHSVSLVCCAQAFHWFDPVATRKEFTRILAPDGACVIFWNFLSKSSDFAKGYQEIEERFGTDYIQVVRRRQQAIDSLPSFFGGAWKKHTFPNFQRLEFSELYGRLISTSYIPVPEDPAHGPMVAALKALFAKHQHDDVIRLDYDCEVYLGRFG